MTSKINSYLFKIQIGRSGKDSESFRLRKPAIEDASVSNNELEVALERSQESWHWYLRLRLLPMI